MAAAGPSRQLVLPGQPLTPDNPEAGPSAALSGGSGTFSRDGKLYASTVGHVIREGGIISVVHPRPHPKPPIVGSVVLGTVSRLTRPQAHVAITSVDGVALPAAAGQDFAGVIRTQDVRAVDKDKVKTWLCFRPGDVVRAEVIAFPVGPGGYLLSTAKNNLGVVSARHAASGRPMRPIGWEEMEDAETGDVEPRKVAAPS